MTVEQKAKAYDEALERVWELLSRCKNNRDRRTMVYRVEDIESIFPELKKSEDEKIKEDLIQWISDFPDMIWSGHYREDVITWLEKQGDKPQGKSALEAIREEKVDNQNCVKSVYNDEPKFKAGDWIVFTNGNVERIISVGTHGYTFDDGDYLLHDKCDKDAHLWTIQDAKDGDVLVNGSNIFIFHFINGTRLMGYCHVNTDNGRFYDDIGKNECFCLIDAVINPATKEQRDLLFQKMKEAGYIFDFKNKELKKIISILML